jgi:hypothetical protein
VHRSTSDRATFVDRVAGGVESVGDVGAGEPDHVVLAPPAGQQDPGLLEALPDRGDEPGEAARRHPHAGGGVVVVEAVADGFERLAMIGLVDLATREHVLATGERRRQRPLQHEDLEPLVAVPDEHHGRRRLHGDGRSGHPSGHFVGIAHDQRPYL